MNTPALIEIRESPNRAFGSVWLTGKTYGSCCGCDTKEQLDEQIRHAKEWARENGDKIIVRDLRQKSKLTAWF